VPFHFWTPDAYEGAPTPTTSQRSVKRLLAYSSIAHAGYFTLALTAADRVLISSLLFYVFVYALATLGAFTVLSILEKKDHWSHHFLDFKGIGREHPLLASLLSFFLFTLIGIPPMAVFVGKLGIFMGLLKNDLLPLAVVFVVASVISAGYYLKVIVFMFLYEKERDLGRVGVSAGESLALMVSSAGVLILGLFPGLLLDPLLRIL